MKSAMDRLSLALACLVAGLSLGVAPAQDIQPPPRLPKPKPLPPIGQNTIGGNDANTAGTTPAGTAPAPAQPAIKPWTPPAYPQGVRSKSLKPTDKLGGEMDSSISLNNAPQGFKIQNVLSIPENLVLDLAAGAHLFALPQVGEKDLKITCEGWFVTHGNAAAPCYVGPYSGRITWQMTCAMKCQYTVFKDIDFNNRGGLMDFTNCLFINCTMKVDGSAGGQIELKDCTFQEGGDATALHLVRSVRGPIVRIKNLKFDGYKTALFIDAYDAAMVRQTLWDVKEMCFTNISGKAIACSDPMRADLGRMFLMGEKDVKEATDKWVEIRTPGNNMKGTPVVNIAGLTPTEPGNAGASVKMPNLEPEKEEGPKGTGAKPKVHDLGDDG